MTKNDILLKLLDFLNLPADYNAAKNRRLKVIRLDDLLIPILQEKTTEETASLLGISRASVSSILKELFPDKKTKQTWLAYILLSISMKLCSACKGIKSLDDFSPDKSKGWHTMCKPCLYQYGSDRYFSNKEQHREWNKNWRANNPDKCKAIAAKRRARKNNATTKDADLDLISIIYSQCPEGYHVDHIIPLSKGGLHHEDNLCYLKASDNLHKKDKLPEEVPYVMARAIFPLEIEGFIL
jgi:5-methylcytosine-specific restriction endonuclease McrA